MTQMPLPMILFCLLVWDDQNNMSHDFYTVDHDILLELLHNKFGINGNALKWNSNYLKPRKFKVNLNKAY